MRQLIRALRDVGLGPPRDELRGRRDAAGPVQVLEAGLVAGRLARGRVAQVAVETGQEGEGAAEEDGAHFGVAGGLAVV